MTQTAATGTPAFEGQGTVAGHLQATLSELTDLSLQGKQAHWNLTGPRFKTVHEHLDELVDAWRTHADTVAERAVAIGVPAAGQAREVAEGSGLEPLPEGWIQDEDAISALIGRLGEVISRVRDRVSDVSELDPVSEGVLIDVLTDLEEQHWMLRASR